MSIISKKLIVFLLVVALVVAAFNIRIKNISFEGNEKVSDTQVARVIFEKDYDSLSAVLFLKNKFAKKKTIPLVNSYSIEWLSPTNIIVHVNEKSVVAFVRRDINNLYFDADGVINEVSNVRRDGAVEVTGIDFKNYNVGEKIEFSDEKLLSAILNISSFLKENSLQASLIEIRKGTDIYIYIGSIIAFMGDTKNMEIKLQRLVDIYPQIKDLSGTLDLKDARENMLDEQYIFRKN